MELTYLTVVYCMLDEAGGWGSWDWDLKISLNCISILTGHIFPSHIVLQLKTQAVLNLQAKKQVETMLNN